MKLLCRAIRPILLLPVMTLALTGCSDAPPPAPPVVAKLQRVALVIPHGPVAYGLNLNDPSFADSAFRHQMSSAGLDLAGELGRSVDQALRQKGYDLVIIKLDAAAPDQFVGDISSEKGKVDGVLDIAIAAAGYAAIPGHPYEPRIDLRFRLTNPNDSAVLNEDSVSYSRAWNPRLFNIVLPPAPGYDFTDDHAVQADPARAAAGLRSGIPELTRAVIHGLPSPTS